MTAEKILCRDVNYWAHQEALARGDFDKFPPDSWLAFKDGFLFYSAPTKEEVFAFLRRLGDQRGVFVTQVQPEILEVTGLFTDPDGGLHRGVAATVRDDNGQEFPVFIEWGTNLLYPRLNPSET